MTGIAAVCGSEGKSVKKEAIADGILKEGCGLIGDVRPGDETDIWEARYDK